MSLTVTKDQQILASSLADWGDHVALRSAARAEVDVPPADRPAGRPAWWQQAVELGLPGLALPESLGGSGAGAEELAIALAELGHRIALGPLAPAAAAGLALLAARMDDTGKDTYDQLLADLADGVRVGVLAIERELDAAPAGDGWLVSGEAGVCIGARDADWLVVRARTPEGPRCFAVDVSDSVTVTPFASLDVTRPLARVSLRDAAVPPARLLLGVDAELLSDLAVTAAAAEAAGIARWAQETATAYAKVREQFGRPIGSFQSIKHLCADMFARAETSSAAAWDAAAAVAAHLRYGDEFTRDQLRLAAAAAGVVALEDAVTNSKDCIQVHGGIGMTWEHDAHLYVRRAMTLRAVHGGTPRWRQRATELGRRGLRRQWTVPLADAAPKTRRRIRALIAELPADAGARRAVLADAGVITPHWPAPYGLGASPIEQLVIAEELADARVEIPDLVVGHWAGPTILEFGTEEQCERFLPPMLRGETVWCQLFSEPGAGSDLAGLRTRAVRVDGGWLLTGQKVWTTSAREADWAICLARTNPDVPNHQGITYFLVDMKSPGIDARPLREITGEALFNEVFLDDVFVPDELVVGEVDDGWRLARATLASERVAIADDSQGLAGLTDLLRDPSSPAFDDRLGEVVGRSQVATALGQQITLRQLEGLDHGAAASIRKLVAADLSQAAGELAVTSLGTDGLDLTDERTAGRVYTFLLGRSGTIAGGSSQIMRNIIAERLLGLPRD